MIPGTSVCCLAALPPGHPPDHPQHVGVVVVGAEDHLEQHGRRGDHQRRQQRPAERVDLDRVGVDLRGQQQHHGVEHQHGDEPERASVNGSRSAATSGDRIAFRIAITAAATSASKNVWTVTCGTSSAADEHRRGRHQPADRDPHRREPRRLRAPGDLLAVGRRIQLLIHGVSIALNRAPGALHTVRTMSPSAADLEVTWLGHATVLLELDGVRVLTDPVLRGRVGPLVRIAPPVDLDALAEVDCVLLSHLHADHADLGSLRLLGDRTPVVAPAGAGRLAARHGPARRPRARLRATSCASAR